MRFLFFCIALILFITACHKGPAYIPDTVITDLTIVQTNTPSPIAQNQNIVSSVSMRGPNLCYRFSHLEIVQETPLLFNIRAKATIPNPDKGSATCQQTTYSKDTTFTIPTHFTGKHVLRFFNGGQLFKTDTVQVN